MKALKMRFCGRNSGGGCKSNESQDEVEEEEDKEEGVKENEDEDEKSIDPNGWCTGIDRNVGEDDDEEGSKSLA